MGDLAVKAQVLVSNQSRVILLLTKLTAGANGLNRRSLHECLRSAEVRHITAFGYR